MNRTLRTTACLAGLLLAGLSGCDGDPVGTDAATPDAGGADAGAPADAGTPADASTPTDAGAPTDASTRTDTGAPLMDGAAPTPDGGGDAGADPSSQIQAARDAAEGAVSLPVSGVIVTYLKPAIGDEGAGFFVQAERSGPALFIAVDPGTLSPTPSVGSTVSFQIDEVATVTGLRQATMISGFTEESTGADVEALRQDLSDAADVVTGLDGYESELISITGTIADELTGAGAGHVAADFDTSAVSGSGELRIRLAETLADSLGLSVGCSLTIDGPMWRFTTTAQPSAFVEDDVTVASCPAPTVLGAVATSETEVRVDFDRPIDPDSVMASGAQFTFDMGLTASAASAAGSSVTLTTDTQTAGATYTVTVADTVTDILGTAVGTPNTAIFEGFVTPATVLINEVQCEGSSGPEDYIELLVLSGGSMGGWTIEEWASGSSPAVEYTFDASFAPTAGDLIVLHYDEANQGSFAQEDDAGSAVDESAGTDSVDAAWDVYTSRTSCTSTDNFLLLRDQAGVVQDSVAYSNQDGDISSTMEGIYTAVRADPSIGWIGFSEDADGTNDATIQGEAAPSADTSGMSAQRDSDYAPGGGGIADTDTNAEWCAASNTMGATNADCPDP